MTGSTAERRRISRLIAGVTRRFCFEVAAQALQARRLGRGFTRRVCISTHNGSSNQITIQASP